MDVFEAMRSAPTSRHFRPDPVDPQVIARVLDSARFAPSGGNRQPWRVVVIDDPALRLALRDLYLPHWRAYLQRTGAAALLEQAQRDPEVAARVGGVRRADHFARHLHEVPLVLMICVSIGDLAITDAELDRPSVVGGASIYPFVQNVLLGLRAEGLGAAFFTLLAPAEPELRELLAIPDELAVAGTIAVGHRTRRSWPSLSRRPVAEFAFSNRFGSPLQA